MRNRIVVLVDEIRNLGDPTTCILRSSFALIILNPQTHSRDSVLAPLPFILFHLPHNHLKHFLCPRCCFLGSRNRTWLAHFPRAPPAREILHLVTVLVSGYLDLPIIWFRREGLKDRSPFWPFPKLLEFMTPMTHFAYTPPTFKTEREARVQDAAEPKTAYWLEPVNCTLSCIEINQCYGGRSNLPCTDSLHIAHIYALC